MAAVIEKGGKEEGKGGGDGDGRGGERKWTCDRDRPCQLSPDVWHVPTNIILNIEVLARRILDEGEAECADAVALLHDCLKRQV